MRIPLTSGAYSSRSIISDAQRCVNLYPELNPTDSPAPTTHYPTPGLTLVSTPPVAGESRGIYVASNGKRFEVVGSNVYFVDNTQAYTLLGTVSSIASPVSMVDNGFDVFLVDGTVPSSV